MNIKLIFICNKIFLKFDSLERCEEKWKKKLKAKLGKKKVKF